MAMNCFLLLCLLYMPLLHAEIICSDGHFLNTSSDACALCPVGHRCPNDDVDEAIPCTPGTAQPTRGELVCIPCQPQRFASTSALEVCEQCYISLLVSNASTACGPDCNAGYYLNATTKSCEAVTKCDVKQQYYTVLPSQQRVCVAYTTHTDECSV